MFPPSQEIEQQTIPEPKKDRKFSFLSEDELSKMKEEEAARIANLTRLDLETLDSLTSLGGLEDTDALLQQVQGYPQRIRFQRRPKTL